MSPEPLASPISAPTITRTTKKGNQMMGLIRHRKHYFTFPKLYLFQWVLSGKEKIVLTSSLVSPPHQPDSAPYTIDTITLNNCVFISMSRHRGCIWKQKRREKGKHPAVFLILFVKLFLCLDALLVIRRISRLLKTNKPYCRGIGINLGVKQQLFKQPLVWVETSHFKP